MANGSGDGSGGKQQRIAPLFHVEAPQDDFFGAPAGPSLEGENSPAQAMLPSLDEAPPADDEQRFQRFLRPYPDLLASYWQIQEQGVCEAPTVGSFPYGELKQASGTELGNGGITIASPPAADSPPPSDIPSLVSQIGAIFYGQWFPDEEQAFVLLRQGGAALRAAFYATYKRELEDEFCRFCDADQYTEALGILWSAIPVAKRIETNLGWFNDDENGMMEVYRGATVAELAVYASDTSTVERHLAQLSDAQAYEARNLIFPNDEIANIGAYIRAANNWVWDDEYGVYNALLQLRPAARLAVWTAYKDDLDAMLTEVELARVKRICVGEDEVGLADEADALTARMELATDGLGTDEEGLHLAAGLAGQGVQRATQLRDMLAAGVDAQGAPLNETTRAAYAAELVQLGDMDALSKDTGTTSFLGLANGDLGASEAADVQQQVGVAPVDVLKARILASTHWYGDDTTAILAAVEGAHASLTLEPGADALDPEQLLLRQQEADAAMLRDLLQDPMVAETLNGMDGFDKARLDAIVAQDAAGAAKARIQTLLGHWQTDEAEIVKLLCGLSDSQRESLTADEVFYNELLNHGDKRWKAAIRAAATTGTIPTATAMDYAAGGWGDGTDEDLLLDTISRMPRAERDQLKRGYVVDRTSPQTLEDGDAEALEAWRALEVRLDAELSAEDRDHALTRLIGLPEPDQVQDGAERLEYAELMLLHQQDRMAMRGNFTALIANTDDTLEIAHAQFISKYRDSTREGEVSLPDFAALAALDQRFNACFSAHEQTSDLAADIGATVGAVVVGIAAAAFTGGPGAATWPAIATWLSANSGAIAGSALVGGIASAGISEGFGGDFRDSGDALQTGVAGSVEVVAAVASSVIAARVMGMAGLHGVSLRAAIVRSVAEGSSQGLRQVGVAASGAALEGVVDGIVGGAVGELVMTLTDAETFKQSLWGVICTAGGAVLRGGSIGGAAGGLAATGVAAAQAGLARRALRGVSVFEDTSLGRLSHLDYVADNTGLKSIDFHVGADATDADIVAYLEAISSMRSLGDVLEKLGGGAFEATVEVEKLQTIVQDRLRQLAGPPLSPGTLSAIRDEVSILESNVEHFASRVGVPGAGSGRIGQFDAPAGYPALPKGPHGEDLYTYFSKGDGEWGVRRLEIDENTPALHVSKDEHGRLRLREGSADELTPPQFATGTTGQQAVDQLLAPDSRSSLKPLFELAEREQLISRQDLVAALGDTVGGATEDSVRHKLKELIKPRLHASLFEGASGPLTKEQSIARMQELLKPPLNSSDYGNMTEDWYGEFARRFNERPNLIKHPALPSVDGAKPRAPDFVEGDTLIDVKSTAEGLSAREVEQLRDYVEAAKTRARVILGEGEERVVKKVRIVFTQEDGARGSLGKLEKMFVDAEGALEVEVFGSSRSIVFTSFEQLEKVL